MKPNSLIWMIAGLILLLLCCPVVSALGQIAFSSNRHYVDPYYDNEIYVMDADGTNVIDLTNNALESEDTYPAWSPDGTKIAFASTRNGGDRNIWVMDADGSNQQRLTGEMAMENRPSWSPDGTKIAFASSRLGGHYDIYVMNADGTGQTRITTTAVDNYPAWSPVGSKIAFASYRDGNYEIYVMNADGTGQTRITTNAADDNYPAWSPDGNKIAFTSNRDGNIEVYVMNANGTNQQRLTNNAAMDSDPAWSPDGARIAFTSYRNGNYEIYVMNADGTGQTRITSHDANDSQPSWGPLPASITVTSPNGGEIWQAGTQHSVTWSQTGLSGTNVKIDLYIVYKERVFYRSIVSSIAATAGTHAWTIPVDIPAGSTYEVRITSLTSPRVYDYTDGWLTITAAPVITVTSPNGGEIWQAGTQHSVTWSQTGLSGTSVKIDLYKDRVFYRSIVSSIAATAGTHAWTIPVDVPAGSTYEVWITSLTSPSVYDFTDGWLTITAAPPVITVTSPNGGEIWQTGTQHSVTWSQTGLSGTSVKIDLYKDRVFYRSIVSSIVATAGTHAWTIPVDIPAGSTYEVWITSLTSPSVYDFTDGWLTITAAPLVANFTTNVTSGTKPLTVKFTDISTGNPTLINMSFGDATWANTTGPWVHTYMNEGTFFPVIYASKGISHSSGTNATISVNVTPGLDPGLAKAYNAVLNNASLLNHSSKGKSVYASRYKLFAGFPVKRWGGKPAITAPNTPGWSGWLIFIDEYPGANWEHPCWYVFVDEAGTITVSKVFSPPTNVDLDLIAGEIPGPGGDANSVNSVSQNPGGGLGPLNLQLACTGPDCSHNYALLISGGFNTTQNHIRYWNDISFMYQTLNQTYGYPTDHITVLMSDGTSPSADRHNATAANDAILTDNSPVNLDVLYGSTDVTGDAKKLTLTNTLTSLNTRLTPADNLFIFTTSHGGWDEVLNSNNSVLYLWNEEYISDTDFVAALPLTPRNITMVMEQCYSGGFVDNFIDKYSGPQRRVITTASNGNEPSWGNGFSNAWTSAVARIDEERLPNFRADINTDNKISMWEAYNYSLTYDPKASSSLPIHEHPQYSAKNPVTAGTTQYLSTCPVPVLPRISITGPNTVVTWSMGYPRDITWTQTGLDSTTVTISLWNRTPGVKQLDIATNVPAAQGIYTWNIPTSLAAGNDYRVNISSVGSPASIVYDQSNSPFILAKYAAPGFITVNSGPSGAGVYLDGYNLSKKTNVTIPGISPGSHNVTVKLAGYYEQDSGINVDSGKTSILNYTMESTGMNEPPHGTMIITSTPPAAEVVINGISTGLMTPYRKEVDPGTYAVTVKADNYTTPASQSITVIKGQPASADFQLTLLPAVIPLPGYSNPPTDPDHDGKYEDLNGNGRLDFADVVLYFNQMEWLAANEPVSAFDLNGNGRIDFADIVKLFGEI